MAVVYMLSKAIAFIEDMPATIIRIRSMKSENTSVYTIEAKTYRGRVELFQLRGNILYHHEVIVGKGIEEKMLFQFSA